jgi:cytochrome P450
VVNPTETEAAEPPGCPFAHGLEFDPMAPGQAREPHPWLKVARDERPVFYSSQYDEWFVTRYEDALDVLRDTARFSSANKTKLQDLPALKRALPDGSPLEWGLNSTDPPEHTRLRKLAQRGFTRPRVASFEPTIRRLADGLIDGFVERRRVDLIQDFSRILTSQVTTAVIGAPIEKAPDFQRNAELLAQSLSLAPPLSAAMQEEIATEVIRFDRWLKEFLEQRRREPGDDFTSFLVTAKGEDGGFALTDVEVVRLMTNVITAAVDTTSTLIGLTVEALLVERSRWERLLADRSLVPAVIEETLRFSGPVHSVTRAVVEDVEIAGVAIPRGATVAVSLASAARDESVFDDPDEFDPEREGEGRHIAFGKWTHLCLGAPLARLEAKVAIEAMLDRLPDLRFGPAGPEILAAPNRLGKFYSQMIVEW